MKKIIFLTQLFILSYCYGQQKTPFILGNIELFESKILSENRTLNIYVPEGYDAKDTIHYPVIYLLDGAADEDFIHIAGIVQFANFSWVDLLPKSIVVGIANVDRKRDLTFATTIEKDKKDYPTTGGSEKFITFIENELQPFIQKNYSTNSSKTIIGQSLGGLLATEILFRRPELFTKYIIVSPSLWWDNQSLLKIQRKAFAANFKKKLSIYIAVGSEGDVMNAHATKLYNTLKSDNLKVFLQNFPAESHATVLHKAVYAAFEHFKKIGG